MKNKLISIILVALLIAPCVPVVSFAEISPNKTEAENYSLSSSSVSVLTDTSLFGNFSGSGYVMPESKDLTYQVNALQSGYYDISFVCSDTDGEMYNISVDINGTKYALNIDSSAKNKWTSVKLKNADLSESKYGIYLNKGTNTLKVFGISDKLLYPLISSKSTYYTYEIEDGEFDGVGEETVTSIENYSGESAIKLYNGSVEMDINVPESRYYNILVTSAAYDGNNKMDNITVNGSLYTVKTDKSQKTWSKNTVTDSNGNKLSQGILLNKGANKIVLNANWGYCAYDKIELETIPYLSAVYVVPDLIAPVSTSGTVWRQSQWNECLRKLKDVGINTVIMQYTSQYWNDNSQYYYYDRNNYNQPDYQRHQVEYALKAAKEYGMQIYLGLQIAEDMWFSNMSEGFTGDFLSKSQAFSITVADELWSMFGKDYSEQIAGWYLPFELNNKQVSGDALNRFINNYLKPVTTHLKNITPNKFTMMSPLVYHDDYTAPANPTYLDIWTKMCKKMWSDTPLDIIAPQDGCGWESTCKENLGEWFNAAYQIISEDEFKATRKSKGFGNAQLWSNSEFYNMNGIDQMPINRLVADMQSVAPYVSAFTSFSMHYFIPFDNANVCGVWDANLPYYNAYKQYYNTKNLVKENSHLPTPTNISVTKSGSFDTCVSFDAVNSNSSVPVVGYVIKRKITGEADKSALKIAEIPQSNSTRINYTDYQLDSGISYTYLVYSFDAFGNRCAVPASAVYNLEKTGFESNRTYSDVISNGKSVSIVSKNNVVSDNNSVNFTDGKFGKKIEDWGTDRNAWCGFQSTVYNGDYTLKLDGLSGKSFGYLYLSMLSQTEIGVNLPSRIDVYLDNTATPIATAYPKNTYKNVNSGNVWVGVSLGKVYSGNSIKIKITQQDEWTMLSEIRLYGAETTAFDNSDSANLLSGNPVMLTSYNSIDGSFGFNDQYGTYLTYNATTDVNSPVISYFDDVSRNCLAGLNGMGNNYTLTVNVNNASSLNLIGSRWIQDENLGIYIPERVDYYGITSSGAVEYISSVKRKSRIQVDWTEAPTDVNLRAANTAEFKTVVPTGKTYSQIRIVVYPKYGNGWTFFDSVYAY